MKSKKEGKNDRKPVRKKGPAFEKGAARGATTIKKPEKRDRGARNAYLEIEEDWPEKEEREDRVEGRRPVLEVLRSTRPVNKIFIEKGNPDPTLARIAALAREKDIPIQYVDKRKLDMMSLTRIHQGVILDAAVQAYVEVEDILRIAEERGEDPFIVILDGITDTNNFGSIIRSAECAGAHGIIIPKRRSATLNATVAKVAAGAQEFIAIARVTNLAQTILSLKEKGIWMIGADPEGEKAYYEAELKGPVGLIIGSEGEGISRVVREECDYLVQIPMKGKISSLNAGVAAGLLLFEIAKNRNVKS